MTSQSSDMMDDTWIQNFYETDKLYQDFYKEDLYYINVTFIYINRSNEIEKINTESHLMTQPNYISREEILRMLKKSTVLPNKLYSLLSIIKFNITLDVEDIKPFLYSDYDNEVERKSLTVVKHIDAITFEKTIHMLQDLNDLIFVLYEKSKELKEHNPNTTTKKIYLKTLHANKKTIRKRYKD